MSSGLWILNQVQNDKESVQNDRKKQSLGGYVTVDSESSSEWQRECSEWQIKAITSRIRDRGFWIKFRM